MGGMSGGSVRGADQEAARGVGGGGGGDSSLPGLLPPIQPSPPPRRGVLVTGWGRGAGTGQRGLGHRPDVAPTAGEGPRGRGGSGSPGLEAGPDSAGARLCPHEPRTGTSRTNGATFGVRFSSNSHVNSRCIKPSHAFLPREACSAPATRLLCLAGRDGSLPP